MMNGSLWKGILAYSVPLAITGMLQQLFNSADVAVIGRFVGKEAMAAVGSTSPIVGLIVYVFVGVSLGTNVVIAHMIGSHNRDGIKKAVHTSILMALIGGLIMTVIGEVVCSPLLSILSVPEDVLPMSVLYLKIYFLGMPLVMLYNFEAAIFRSQGDTRTPMIALTSSGVLNVGLNILFVCVFHMTVDGVALATIISNFLSAVLLLIILIRKSDDFHLSLRDLKIDGKTMKKIIKIGLPSGVQSMVFQIANIYLQSAVNSLGTTVMAASAAAYNIEAFSYHLIGSFGQACTTFVGQNHGAGNDERCVKTVRWCLLLDYILTIIVCSTCLLFRYQILSLFNTDPEVIRNGYIRLYMLFGSYLFSILMEVYSGYMRGYGKPLPPTVITLVFVCGIRFFWIYKIFPLHPTFITIIAVFPISISITAIVITVWAIVYRKKHVLKKYSENH